MPSHGLDLIGKDGGLAHFAHHSAHVTPRDGVRAELAPRGQQITTHKGLCPLPTLIIFLGVLFNVAVCYFSKRSGSALGSFLGRRVLPWITSSISWRRACAHPLDQPRQRYRCDTTVGGYESDRSACRRDSRTAVSAMRDRVGRYPRPKREGRLVAICQPTKV